MKLYIATHPDHAESYRAELAVRAKAVKLELEFTEFRAKDEIEVILYEPSGPVQDFSQFPKLRLVQSTWAGVDGIVRNQTLTQTLCRMVDTGLSEGMREYVCGHILADHIRLRHFMKTKTWDGSVWTPLARGKLVGILGMGTLGSSVTEGLKALGFKVAGWSRSGGSGHFSGRDGLEQILASSDYLVTLLPHTAETENIINRESLRKMKPVAMLINPGRGALIDEDDLLQALDQGQIRRAILDVFKNEPLADDHPFWTHPRVLVTPHIAAKSRVETACETIIENLIRLRDGRELLYKVDRLKGY